MAGTTVVVSEKLRRSKTSWRPHHGQEKPLLPSEQQRKATGVQRPRLQLEVIRFAMTRPNGFTDEQMNEFFDTHRSTYRARRSELVDKDLIVDSGRKGSMTNGRKATIWVLKQFNGNPNMQIEF